MRRVLVANRGEIAARVIRTVHRLGLESVAVFGDEERGAAHVGMATHRIPLGPAAELGFLSIDRILDAAERTAADAVHPGYGFLAEDADFADAVERAGLTFVGPTPTQIRAFGAKDTARTLAAAAGVPLVPASGPLTDPEEAAEAAGAVGFPLLVKSVAGGGGIGMVLCSSAAELADAVGRATRQSAHAFGDPRVFLERAVMQARHVEVQVFGDGAGRVVVLGDRDCSTQRRRQKVIEEAPAAGLADDQRATLHDAARALLEPLQYRSAGTVEFVVDAHTGEQSFLEVNTRLQVEHTVTEATTGLDLVELMLRLAAGERDVVPAATPAPQGHAIQVRVYAEDPAKDFLPAPGTVTHVEWPATTRVDTWIAAGTDVGPHYDPLLAKLVVHAASRGDAIEQTIGALDATRIDGIETNLALMRAFVAGDPFRADAVTTTMLEQWPRRFATVDVVAAGATTVQDWPGRSGYWHVGVPPSGPMDARSFRLGNTVLGNDPGAPGLECTAVGPTLRFNAATWVCLTGARTGATLDGAPVPWATPVAVAAGATLDVGSIRGAGLRTYVLVRGGFDVPHYLGRASTFTLGGFGGHGGRALEPGDVLHLAHDHASEPAGDDGGELDDSEAWTHHWDLHVVDGPHGAPDFLTEDGLDALYDATWTVHYNSSRTGVRLVGPKPRWARADGGEAGLHPSNIHDSPYTVGAVDLTGDMPIILGPDGPSLGGFVCPCTVTSTDLWKVGQLAAGDIVRFTRTNATPIGTGARATSSARLPSGVVEIAAATNGNPAVTYRRAGSHALLVEYGPMTLDLDLRLRVGALAAWLADAKPDGITDVTPGIRSLQVQVDGERLDVDRLLTILRTAERELPATDDVVVPSRVVHMPLSWDDPATREAIARYMRVVRDDAPWCPWNIEFIRRINGLDDVEAVRDIVFGAEYIVLGLGDVYLGAPVAVPVDPRHRLVTTKYNPARTWTPENAVGIGGTYMCIYGMEGPGGYQFVGRTVPVWHRYGTSPHTTPETPWLLRFFDRIRFYPVSAEELLELRAESKAGRLSLDIEDGTFARTAHHESLRAHHDEILEFRTRRERAFAAERAEWEARGELARFDDVAALEFVDTDADVLGDLPDGAVVVESHLQASVWKVHVREGMPVAAGETVVTVEAMKMETRIASPVGGVVHRVVCEEGTTVRAGAALVVVLVDA